MKQLHLNNYSYFVSFFVFTCFNCVSGPPRPTLVEVSSLDTGGVVIKWLAPTEPFDGEIKQYEITLRPEGEGESHIVRTKSPTLLEKTVGGLKQKTTYFVSVKAVSGAGPGLMSEEWVVKTEGDMK